MHDETRRLHLDLDAEPFRALTTPVPRSSTLIFPTVEDFLTRHWRFYDGYSYVLYGHPASRALARQIAALEEGKRTLIVPSGMAAISVVNLALLRPGDHVLLPDAVYAPARSAAERSDERRVGKECVSTCQSRGSPDTTKKTTNKNANSIVI